MGPHNRIEAESAWLYRLFALGPARVSLTGEMLHVEELLGSAPAEIPIGAIDSITVRPSWFWHRLTIRLGDGTERSIGGLGEKEAARVRDAAIAAAAQRAKTLSLSLKRSDERLRQLLAGDRYARYRDSRRFHEALAPVLRECKGLIRERLEPIGKVSGLGSLIAGGEGLVMKFNGNGRVWVQTRTLNALMDKLTPFLPNTKS